MIYTVGYQRLSQRSLVELCDVLAIQCVIDVRSTPASRRSGFSRGALAASLGSRYEWKGDYLGGRGKGPSPAGLDALAREPRRVLLLCLEESPGDCHRHRAIAVTLEARGVPVWHVYRDELIRASELQRSIDDGDDYDCSPLPGQPLDASAASTSAADW